MERIVIEVEDSTAKKWRVTSQQRRKDISQIINIKLAKALVDSKEEFKHFLDEVRATMHERGLTEEILQDILKDDD